MYCCVSVVLCAFLQHQLSVAIENYLETKRNTPSMTEYRRILTSRYGTARVCTSFFLLHLDHRESFVWMGERASWTLHHHGWSTNSRKHLFECCWHVYCDVLTCEQTENLHFWLGETNGKVMNFFACVTVKQGWLSTCVMTNTPRRWANSFFCLLFFFFCRLLSRSFALAHSNSIHFFYCCSCVCLRFSHYFHNWGQIIRIRTCQ